MAEANRQWLLADRPRGRAIYDGDFRYEEAELPILANGQALARVLWLGFDPAQKGWMENIANYVAPMEIGEVMRGSGIAQIVESSHPELCAGDLVQGTTGWRDYVVIDSAPQAEPFRKIQPIGGVPVTQYLSTLGITGLTAFFGLTRIGKPVAGDTVVVSGAAGATGSVVGQLAKLMGCRAVGIAGGPQKCDWLTELGYDSAIDYKNDSVRERLRAECPNGIDVFYDNTGGPVLNDALACLARGARVVICGGISRYETGSLPAGPENYFNLIFQRASMQGFIVLDFAAEFPEARRRLGDWLASGRLKYREDIQEGLENAPQTLRRLFSGQNFGKQLLKVADPPLPISP